MRLKHIVAGAIAAAGLGLAASAASAAPLMPHPDTGHAASNPLIEQVYWRRVCDRDGDRCRQVWIPDGPRWNRGYDRDDWRWRHRDRDHDRDDRWRGRDRDDRR